MKPKNMKIVADYIERTTKSKKKPKVGFNMMDYFQDGRYDRTDHSGHECGTTACIAGFTVLALDGLKALRALGSQGELKDRAMKLLGLTDNEADQLFVPGGGAGWVLSSLQPVDAVRTLRLASITKKIEWVTGLQP